LYEPEKYKIVPQKDFCGENKGASVACFENEV
jgi:hypothetical protein